MNHRKALMILAAAFLIAAAVCSIVGNGKAGSAQHGNSLIGVSASNMPRKGHVMPDQAVRRQGRDRILVGEGLHFASVVSSRRKLAKVDSARGQEQGSSSHFLGTNQLPDSLSLGTAFSEAREGRGVSRSDASAASMKSSTVEQDVSEPITAPPQSPRASVAAALYQNLSDEEFSRLGAHEQAAVAALGAYAAEATDALDAPPQSEGSHIVEQKNRISSETDSYLRMSLGHERFNRLSFIAAANRKARAVPTAPTSNVP